MASGWGSEGLGLNHPHSSRQPLTPGCQKISNKTIPSLSVLLMIDFAMAHFKRFKKPSGKKKYL